MKRLIFILVICFSVSSVFIFGLSQTPKQSNTTGKVTTEQTSKQMKKTIIAKVMYTCPMHPEVIVDKPGKCPKCGMNLVKKEPAKKVAQVRK